MTVAPDSPFRRLLPLKGGALDGDSFSLAATVTEESAVARLLEVERVADLRVEGRWTAVDGMMRLEGQVSAAIVQPCVVTFEPVQSDARADFERYVVIGVEPGRDTVEVGVDDRDIVYVAEPVIDVGAVAVEELALATPVYPRAANADALLADLDRDDQEDGPFAVLARRRDAS